MKRRRKQKKRRTGPKHIRIRNKYSLHHHHHNRNLRASESSLAFVLSLRSNQSIATKHPSRYLLSFHLHQFLQLKAAVDSYHTVLSLAAAAAAPAATVGTIDRVVVQEREKRPRHKTMHLVAAVPYPHHLVVAAVAEQFEHLQTEHWST